MDLEDRVRLTLTDDRLALAAWPDPVSRVRAGMSRRRLRRVTLVVAVAVAAVVSAVPLAMTRAAPAPVLGPSPTPPPTAVAWLDTPATDLELASPPTPRPLARPCTASDIATTATFSDDGAAMSSHYFTVMLRHAGSGRCTLSGSARVEGTDAANGRRKVLETTHDGVGESDKQYPATLDRGEFAMLDVVAATGCRGGQGMEVYRDVSVVLPIGEYPVSDLTLETTCPIGIGDWYLAAPHIPAAPRFGSVTASIEAPATVPAGGTLEYVVTLRSTVEVTFDPCPAYAQGLFKSGGYYRLNCAVAGVPAGGTVKYAMRMPVADYTPLGPQTLSWCLIDGEGTSARAESTVEVTG